MKILICLYSINNYGGITTYVEELAKGFKALGHRTSLVLLTETNRKPYVRRHSKRPGNFESVWPNMSANPDTGWGGVWVYSYADRQRIDEFHELASKFDAVVWGVPVPSWSKLHLVPSWRRLYNMEVPQIAVVHDGNFRYLYPHLNAVAGRLEGVACVHGSAFQSAQQFDGRYALIPNPHPGLRDDVPEWETKKVITVAAHMWKAWKHMELPVLAAPHLKRSKIVLAGDGIERRYMTSKDKCKPKYEGIWNAMMNCGNARYLDILPHPRLVRLYDGSRVMFDPSFSRNYNKMGSHFNRSIIEAYNSGCVPVCVQENMELDGVFENGRTHIGIPASSTPAKIARVLDRATNMSADEAAVFVNAGRRLVKKVFHRDVIAQNMLNLLSGEPAGIHKDVRQGSPSDRMAAATKNILQGGRPSDRVL